MLGKTASYRYVLLIIIALAYFFVFFHRMSTAVMAPDLSTDFGIDLVQVGLFGSMYFYAYALAQLASGILADRWGPRKARVLMFLFGFFAYSSILIWPNLRENVEPNMIDRIRPDKLLRNFRRGNISTGIGYNHRQSSRG